MDIKSFIEEEIKKYNAGEQNLISAMERCYEYGRVSEHNRAYFLGREEERKEREGIETEEER